MIEMLVPGVEREVMLHRQCCNPDIMVRNGSALPSKLNIQIGISVDGILVWIKYRNSR